MSVDDKSNNIYSYLIFNCLICDSRSLKCVLGYGLGIRTKAIEGLGLRTQAIEHSLNIDQWQIEC